MPTTRRSGSPSRRPCWSKEGFAVQGIRGHRAKREPMIETIERMLTDLERGKLTRRQFAVSIAILAAGSLAAPGTLAAPPAPAGFRAVSVNHITVKVPDLHRTSKFYQDFFGMSLRQRSATTHILGVGKSFFGIEQGDKQLASVNHYDFGI